MTTQIFNQHNQCISEGKNLGILLRKARAYSGVSRIAVDELEKGNALVNVFYANGYRACTNFSDYLHAVAWAENRSAASPRQSWFAGCKVEVKPRSYAADVAKVNPC